MNIKVKHSHEGATPAEAMANWLACDKCAAVIRAIFLDNLLPETPSN